MRLLAKLYLTALAVGALVASCLVRVHTSARLGPLAATHHPRLIMLLLSVVAIALLLLAFIVSIMVAVRVVTER